MRLDVALPEAGLQHAPEEGCIELAFGGRYAFLHCRRGDATWWERRAEDDATLRIEVHASEPPHVSPDGGTALWVSASGEEGGEPCALIGDEVVPTPRALEEGESVIAVGAGHAVLARDGEDDAHARVALIDLRTGRARPLRFTGEARRALGQEAALKGASFDIGSSEEAGFLTLAFDRETEHTRQLVLVAGHTAGPLRLRPLPAGASAATAHVHERREPRRGVGRRSGRACYPDSMSTHRRTDGRTTDLPAVDERLIMPETRFEVLDGRVIEVAPADPPHATRHSKAQAILEAHVAPQYEVACDMLTRTSKTNDFAPDASIYPLAPDPETGGRQLEELAFEIVSTQTLADAGTKAEKLVQRGVRRMFAIDVERKRALEWSRATESWEILATDARIADRVFATPLPVSDLVGAAKSDDAVARALLAKRNPVLEQALADRHAEGKSEGGREGKREGKAESVLAILSARGLPMEGTTRAAILAAMLAEPDDATLDRWLARALEVARAEDLLAR